MISLFKKIIRKFLLKNKFTFIGKFKSLEEAKNYSSKTTTYLNNESDKQNTEEFIKFVNFEPSFVILSISKRRDYQNPGVGEWRKNLGKLYLRVNPKSRQSQVC